MSETPSRITMQERFPHVTPEFLEEVSRLGESIYENLKPQLEPAHDRQFITIHVDTGDYAIAKNSSTAARAIRERHPLDGRLYGRKIGNEPEYGLASRIMASEMGMAQSK